VLSFPAADRELPVAPRAVLVVVLALRVVVAAVAGMVVAAAAMNATTAVNQDILLATVKSRERSARATTAPDVRAHVAALAPHRVVRLRVAVLALPLETTIEIMTAVDRALLRVGVLLPDGMIVTAAKTKTVAETVGTTETEMSERMHQAQKMTELEVPQ
jgi:hypothetical protein